MQLHNSGRDTEALTLCLTYADSFAQWLYWPDSETGRTFVNGLGAFETSPYFSLSHPQQAIRAFKQMNSYWPAIAEPIEEIFPGPQYELLPTEIFLARLAGLFPKTRSKEIAAQAWRGTMGAIAYHWLRNPSIHSFGSSTALEFSTTTYNGHPVAGMDLCTFLPPLRSMIEEAGKRSTAICQWFGHDLVPDA